MRFISIDFIHHVCDLQDHTDDFNHDCANIIMILAQNTAGHRHWIKRHAQSFEMAH